MSKYFPRIIERKIKDGFFKGKVIIIYGARRVGKTTMVAKICADYKAEGITARKVQGDIPSEQAMVAQQHPSAVMSLLGDDRILYIDEAQNIMSIGSILKTLVDNLPNSIQIIVTGSSSLELAHEVSDAMTGRYLEYRLYPLCSQEVVEGMRNNDELFSPSLSQYQDYCIRYGWYPEVFPPNEDSARDYLQLLQASYLYKDILSIEKIKNTAALNALVTYLAYHVGKTLSINGISKHSNLNYATTTHYLDLLEKIFVIKKVYCYHRNTPKALRKTFKIYFLDVGIRNSILNNFAPRSIRQDIGSLFENYIFVERFKYLQYTSPHTKLYFWRDYDGHEIDFVEVIDESITAMECKYQPSNKIKGKIKGKIKEKIKGEKQFAEHHPGATISQISWDDYHVKYLPRIKHLE